MENLQKTFKICHFNESRLLFAGLNLNRIIQKKKYQKKAHFMDDA